MTRCTWALIRILLGCAVALACEAQVYNYFPPPGMTYSAATGQVGASSLVLGAPTGGNKGAGSLNTQTLFVQGVAFAPVKVAAGQLSSTCVLSNGNNVASASQLATGKCNAVFTSSFFVNQPTCVATIVGVAALFASIVGTSDNTQVTTFTANSGGSGQNQGVFFICTGT
jgi:hypothetical protein